MTLRSPRAIALLAALCSALVAGLVWKFYPGGGAAKEVILVAGVFIATGASTWWLVQCYVQARVELIHRTMHDVRKGRGDGAKPSTGLQVADTEVAA